MSMCEEYDFTGGKRGVFHRPGQPKRFVITLDHLPQHASFELSQDENGQFAYSLKREDGEPLLKRGPFDSRDEARKSIEEFRESIIAAETVDA